MEQIHNRCSDLSIDPSLRSHPEKRESTLACAANGTGSVMKGISSEHCTKYVEGLIESYLFSAGKAEMWDFAAYSRQPQDIDDIWEKKIF